MANEKNDTVQLDTKKLDAIATALKKSINQKIQVGIFSNHTGRGTAVSGVDNATLGAWHEFGTSSIPRRSFLQMPISTYFPKRLEDSGAMDAATLKEVILNKSFGVWLQKIAVLAEATVQEAFDTQGFGTWPGWADGYTNNSGQVLVDTGQLRRSITSRIKE
jgi:phage gpG-like protein